MRRTTLKPDKTGQYYRNLGWKRSRNGNVGQHKFMLGPNRKEAEARNALLERLWQSIEDRLGERAAWDEFTLSIGTTIARGQTELLLQRRSLGLSYISGQGECYENDSDYARRLNDLQMQYPFVRLLPDSVDAYHRGGEQQAQLAKANLDRLQKGAAEFKQELLRLGQPIGGEMLHDALWAYLHWIEIEYFVQAEGHIGDNGMTKIRQVKSIIAHLENVPLAALDFKGTEALFAYFRKRPLSRRTDRPMKVKLCKNYIGELGRFLSWLHLSPDYEWRKPDNYEFIKKTPDEMDEDVEAEANEVPTYTIEQLCVLNEYATPIERVFFLLGINCAFGSDQSGRLKIREVHLSDDGPAYIRRVRRKMKVIGIHRLFAQTVEAMRWAIEQRRKQEPSPTPDNYLLVNDKGRPYWRKTEGGNRCRDIANMWYRLLDRIRVDHPDFPRHGFNTLRDTSATMIREIAGEEVASMHLTHKHQSSDKNLRRYANAPKKKLFRAQRRLEERLQPVFNAAPREPFLPQPQAYTSRKTIKKIIGLRNDGVPISQIARTLKVARTTVYRHLQREDAQEQLDS